MNSLLFINLKPLLILALSFSLTIGLFAKDKVPVEKEKKVELGFKKKGKQYFYNGAALDTEEKILQFNKESGDLWNINSQDYYNGKKLEKVDDYKAVLKEKMIRGGNEPTFYKVKNKTYYQDEPLENLEKTLKYNKKAKEIWTIDGEDYYQGKKLTELDDYQKVVEKAPYYGAARSEKEVIKEIKGFKQKGKKITYDGELLDSEEKVLQYNKESNQLWTVGEYKYYQGKKLESLDDYMKVYKEVPYVWEYKDQLFFKGKELKTLEEKEKAYTTTGQIYRLGNKHYHSGKKLKKFNDFRDIYLDVDDRVALKLINDALKEETTAKTFGGVGVSLILLGIGGYVLEETFPGESLKFDIMSHILIGLGGFSGFTAIGVGIAAYKKRNESIEKYNTFQRGRISKGQIKIGFLPVLKRDGAGLSLVMNF